MTAKPLTSTDRTWLSQTDNSAAERRNSCNKCASHWSPLWPDSILFDKVFSHCCVALNTLWRA